MDRSTILRIAVNQGVMLTDSQLDDLDCAIKNCPTYQEKLVHLMQVLLLYKEDRKHRNE